MPIIEAIDAIAPDTTPIAPESQNAVAIAPTKKQKAKSLADERFTVSEAIAYYFQKSGKQLSERSFTQNAKKYGFAIKERGSGLYALIES